MKTKLIAAVLVAVSAAVAAPAFASGYGPAPFYRPADGAPASQRGQSSQTVASEQNAVAGAATEAFGGVADGASQSGARHVASVANDVYKAH
ncbi:DUF4148 domain-containing protein [Paraburkholderia kururiensis]|uniref:hypothetical protein n=2 Tax=Burkholderiaceae TaxID=119060 RepID=UPI000345ABEB|nr:MULTISPECIES: hypothetical protein [Paraburkholderia]WEY41932.1 hypothetical protein P2869_17825 [Paraburkholderia sp. SUR17]